MVELPDIVKNARLVTEFHPGYTRHVQYQSGDTLTVRRNLVEEKWKRERELGHGTFGTVWLERKLDGRSDPELRAVKVMPRKSDINMDRELEAVALFSHPRYRACFVESYGWYEDEDSLFIAMEYLPKGDLQQYLDAPIPESEVQGITFQLLEGLNHMHENHFTHRDLKPANILVKCNGPAWWVKIADFGLSKRAASQQTVLRTLAGTLAYIAPEILGLAAVANGNKPEAYTNAVDIWSLGAIVFQLLTQAILFEDMRDLAQFALGMAELPRQPLMKCHVSEQARIFISKMLSPRPEERPSARTLMDHPWITSYSDAHDGEPKTVSKQRTESAGLPVLLKNNFPENDHQTSDRSGRKLDSASNTSHKDQTDSPRSWVESARNLHRQGIAQHERSEFAAAERTFENAISIYEKVVGHDSKETAASIFWLGRAQFSQDKFKTAAKSFKDSVEVYGVVLDRPQADIASSMYWLGQALWELKQWSDAEPMFMAAHAIRHEVLGADHIDTLHSAFWTGRTQLKLTKYAQAEISLRSVYDRDLETRGPHDKDTLDACEFLADALFYLEKHHEAESKYREAVTGCEFTYGVEHQKTAQNLYSLGRAQNTLKKFAEAEKSLQKAANIFVKISGLYGPFTACSCHHLGIAQFEQKKFTLATRSFVDAHTMRQKRLGDSHVCTRDSQAWLTKASKAKRMRLFTGGK